MTADIAMALLAGVGISVLGAVVFWMAYSVVAGYVDRLRYRRAFAREDRLDSKKEIHR